MIVAVAKRGKEPVERQIHPTGERFTVDDAWKARVRAELVTRDWTQADLAAKISVVPASITNLLKPGVSQTRLVRRVQKVFGWVDDTAPVVAIGQDEALRRIQRKWGDLTDADKANIANIVESLTAKR